MAEPPIYQPDDENKVYDQDSEHAIDKPDLHALENGGESTDRSQDHLNTQPSGSGKSASPNDLASQESQAGSKDQSGPSHTQGSKNKDDFNYHEGDNRSLRQRALAGGLFGRSGAAGSQGKKGKGKKKALLIAGALGGLGLGAIIIIVIFIIGLLKIPDFAEHIAAYQFSRVTRTFLQDDLEVTSEEAALQSASDGGTSILNSFGNLKDNVVSKFQKFSPQAVQDSLESDGTLKYNYEPSRLTGVKKLTSITLNGEDIDVSTATANSFSKLFHPIATFQAKTEIAGQLSEGLQNSLRDTTGVLIRGAVENNIRKDLDIGLITWAVGKYQGKTPQQADDQQETDAETAIDETTTEPSAVVGISDAEAAGKAQEQSDLKNPSAVTKIANNNGIDAAADAAAQSTLSSEIGESGVVSWLISHVDPAYAISVPLCIIYDGSIDSPNTSSTIDAQDNEDQRAFYLVETAADQQKAGQTTGEAVGAMNWKLGDITESNAELRASGDQVNTLDTSISPQASPDGQYSVLNTFLPAPVAGGLDDVGNTICPILTNIKLAGLVAIVAIVGTVLSDGGTGIVDGAADSAAGGLSADVGTVTVANEGADTLLGGLLSKVAGVYSESAGKTAAGVGDKVAEALGIDSKAAVTKQGITLAGITGITLAARAITQDKMNSVSNGLSVGGDFANQADAGGDVNANEVERQQFYGVAMNNTDTTESQQEDAQYVADQTKTEPAYERYLALDNPTSLLNKLGTTLAVHFNGSIFSSAIKSIGKIFNPLPILAKAVGSVDSRVALAASTTSQDTQDYGVVQWGWPTNEENLINSSPSYQPLENAQIFTQEDTASGGKLETDIENTFGNCFTGTMGSLLAGSSNPAIIRDSNGNVTGGTCSESQLGPSNNFDGQSQSVFRWRLMQAYNATLDQLTQVQSTGSSS